MWTNYIKTAWRHVIGNRLFSLINILGLSVGLMSCMLILLFVKVEAGYDTWLQDHERIVRMHSSFKSPDGRPPFKTVRSAGRMKQALVDNAPDLIESATRLMRQSPTVRAAGSADVFAEVVTFADATTFDVFDLPFAHGDADTAFQKPMDLLVTEEIAIKYFGRTDVMGETLQFCCLGGRPIDGVVTGVLKDIPQDSHLAIDFMVFTDESWFRDNPSAYDTFNSVNVYTYFKMKEGVTRDALQQRLYQWLNSTDSPFYNFRNQIAGVSDDEVVTDYIQPDLMPIADIYLEAQDAAGSMGDMKALGDGALINTFVGVAGLILLIAGINFINLSTARATRRAREVAVRKVLGASRTQVAAQFLAEAVGLVFLAFIIALAATDFAVPYYGDVIGRTLSTAALFEPATFASLLVATLFLGLLAGLYPALVLSRFLPVKTLKANQSNEGSAVGGVRQILVVFQFAVSIGLAVCTMVVYGQTLYARTVDTGYSVENKLAVWSPAASDGLSLETMADALSRLDGVSSAVMSSEVPTQDWENNREFSVQPDGSETSGLATGELMNIHGMGYGFFRAYDVRILAGREFDESFGTDRNRRISGEEGADNTVFQMAAVINASAARKFGFQKPADAVGRTLTSDDGRRLYSVVGVIEDLHFRSIKFGIRPSVYMMDPNRFNIITLNFDGVDPQALVSKVQETWRRLAPANPIEHQFVGEMVANEYAREAGEATLFAAFSGLAIFVASLGLYGLASFTAERRTKEMGIRKVMGARVVDIIRLMVWQFSKPVLLANIIAWPVSWFVMQNWLLRFQYRLDDSFILVTALTSGLVALLIAWLTVVGRSLAVARANPIAALRYE